MTDKSEAYLKGIKAGEDGLKEEDNPYELMTQESEEWKHGRWDAANSDATKEGYVAGVKGVPPSTNPYEAGSIEAEEWEVGRMKARYSLD